MSLEKYLQTVSFSFLNEISMEKMLEKLLWGAFFLVPILLNQTQNLSGYGPKSLSLVLFSFNT